MTEPMPAIVDLVKRDLELRKPEIEPYTLEAAGALTRDGLQQVYEEALDLTCYLKWAIEERRTTDSRGKADA